MIKRIKVQASKTEEVTISQETAIGVAYDEVIKIACWGGTCWGIKDGKLYSNTGGVDWKGRPMDYVRDATELDLATWLILSKLKEKSLEFVKEFSKSE